ncbi:MAG TPA: methyltransferase domain-containing protein [Pseudonocardiaceae bacterium]|nr:methyltransferase domain-containing protein [Pseudonocardiaceae bacterium]
MLITSRSAREYRAMFDLAELSTDSVLDCCAGGASFTADLGGAAVALDPVYAMGQAKLAEEIRIGQQGASAISYTNAEHFDWSWYGSRERREEMRAEAARHFLADIAARPGRYVAGDVHHLPFADNSFDLVLCSHLLFTWSDVLDDDWHRRAIRELLRVSRGEVRIFPTVVQKTGNTVPFLPALREDFAARGVSSRFAKVPYHFQVGADEMLVFSSTR